MIKTSLAIRGQKELDQVMGKLSGREAAQAHADALNDTGHQARRVLGRELQEEFDRPTPFIYRSPKFIPATPDKLSIAVLPTTPVITARESMEGPATEVWRGSAVALVVPPVPVGGHPYPPTYFTIPNPLEIFGFEYEPTADWTNAWLWTRLFVTGSGSAVALAGPSVFVSNGVLIVSTWGRCMSGELVATATRGGVELGQLSLTLVAENFLG